MRVLMFSGNKTFKRDWASAARLVAEVITVENVTALTFPNDGSSYISRNPHDESDFQLLRPQKLGHWPPNHLYNHWSGKRLTRLLQHLASSGKEIDLVHGHFYASCGALPYVKKSLGKPYIITEHSSKLSGSPRSSATPQGLRNAQRIYEHAFAVLCVSDFLRAALYERGLITEALTIPNPVDIDIFHYTEKTEPNRDTIRCVNVGRLAPIKAHDLLIKSFAQAVAVDPRLMLTIVGSGPELERLIQLRELLGLQRVVEFVEYESSRQVAAILRTSDLFVLSSQFETFGVTVIEALCTGTPVVSTAAGAAAELVDSTNGIVVSNNDVTALADGILRVATDLDNFNLRKIADQARALYSLESVAEELSRIYSDALA